MILEGKFKLSAPIQRVWDSLLNPEVLAACVPGCEKVEVIDDETYSCIIAAKVGSISARFSFITKLSDMDPPRHLKATGKGDELGKAATFTQETVMDLEELADDEVQVSYRANVNIVGKLATFGDRIMKAKAKQVQEGFTRSLEQRLTAQTEALTAAAQAEAPAATAESEAPAATAPSEAPAATAPSAAPIATAPTEAPIATAPSLAPSTPALKVSFGEMIVAFFAVLWDKIKSIFGGSEK
jgi:carbon monoxide dehydrogenase subunit G